MKKNKTRALAKRKPQKMAKRPVKRKAALAVIPKQDRLALAAQKKGMQVTSSARYFRPLIPPDQVLWRQEIDKKTKEESWKPFIPWQPIEDNLHRRGIKSMDVTSLPPEPCTCYSKSPGDMTYRARAVITLTNGQVFTEEGDACIHNTWCKDAVRRIAATRAKARAGRDATNIAAPCMVELTSIEGTFKVSGRILRKEEVEKVVDGVVIDSNSKAPPQPLATTPSTLGTQPTPAQPDSKPPESAPAPEPDKGPPMTDEQRKASNQLHAEAHRLGLNVEQLHKYIHHTDEVSSIRDLPPDKLARWAEQLRSIKQLGGPNHKRIIDVLARMEGKP